MKGIICYYSGSGNTKLACNYLKGHVTKADFELYNIVRNDVPDFSSYDIVGFATFTDFFAPPKLMHSFVNKIADQGGKKAFVLNTFGFTSGKLLQTFSGLAENAGFDVLTGFSLHTPEAYPPMRKRGLAADNAPNEKELKKFDAFISDLAGIVEGLKNGREVGKRKIVMPLAGKILPARKRTQAKKDFGIQKVDTDRCNECGICMKGCPYEAITMNPKPVFDHDVCAGCWRCYNNCPKKAIYTNKFRGDYQYHGPSEKLKNKLKA